MASAYVRLARVGPRFVRPYSHLVQPRFPALSAIAVDPYSEDLHQRQWTYRETINAMFPTSSPSIEVSRKLQIVSDVHLEFYRTPQAVPFIERHGHDLALLGDIGKPFDPSYRWFLERQSDKFDNVFVLLGNHEFYNSDGKTVAEIVEKAREVCSSIDRGNVHLLERSSFNLTGRTRLLGTTLWSDIDQVAARGLNDFRMINSTNSGKLTQEEYLAFHKRDVAWLEHELETCINDERQAIVLTHHGPLIAMAGKYRGSDLNPAFVTNLYHLFRPPVKAFASGHVHSNCDVSVHGIRSVSNAIGYPGETTGYRKDVIIEVE